jgi:hypothetical protein
MSELFTLPKQVPIQSSGAPWAGAKAYFYRAGTTTDQSVYTDAACSVAHAQPVVADANGVFAPIYKNPAASYDYRLQLKQSDGTLIYDVDNIPRFALTQAQIGALFYLRTAAESAASVTPTAYSRFYIDVARQGATGDGATDDTTAVQAALDAAAIGYSRVHFPSQNRNGQTIYLVGQLSVYEGTLVTADEGVIVRSTITGANDHVFECISTLGTGVALSANTAKRDSTVTTATTTGLAAGMVVCIRDTQYKYSTNGRNLEFNEIDSISGSGPYTITLRNRLIGAYLTASTAEIVPVSTPARNIAFEGVHVDIPSGKDGGAFYFQEAYECRVTNCRSSGQKGQPGVQIWRSAYIRVDGGDYSHGQSQSTSGYGYGINIAQSSHHCEARGVLFQNVRECAVALGSKHCGYVDCVSVSSYDNGFNTHADGNEDCYFINCHSYYARSKGFYAGGVTGQAADKRIRFINCESHYSGYMGFWANGDSGVESEDISFERCKAFHFGDDTGTSYGFYAFRSTRPRILDCFADADGETNARALVKVEICTDAQVKRCDLRSATSGWGVIHANCTGVTIDDNTIANIGSSQGVHAESTASTAVYVRRNKLDNDVAFTKNAGDIHEFNEWNTKRQWNKGAAASTADGGTITHGLITTPTSVRCVGSVANEFVSVTATSSTTFTVAIKKHDSTAGTSQTIYWEAEY